MKNVKIITRPGLDGPDVIHAAECWLNLRYSEEISVAVSLVGRRAQIPYRVGDIPKEDSLRAHRGKRAIVWGIVFDPFAEDKMGVRYFAIVSWLWRGSKVEEL